MKLNIPNQLTLLRMLLIPVFVACYIYIKNPLTAGIVAAILFAVASLTDMLDGKIARKYNLVTTFGKVMDPLADKFMVFMAMISLTIKLFLVANTTNDKVLANVTLWVSAIVIFRELGVTSIRLVASNAGAGVIPANFFGKAKTVTQIIAILVVLIELAVNKGWGVQTLWIASYFSLALMTFMTVGSGVNYLKGYWKYIMSSK